MPQLVPVAPGGHHHTPRHHRLGQVELREQCQRGRLAADERLAATGRVGEGDHSPGLVHGGRLGADQQGEGDLRTEGTRPRVPAEWRGGGEISWGSGGRLLRGETAELRQSQMVWNYNGN